ncbi:MAG: hypothetical protein HY525_02695 [Betaproteobacteria bacterium]|nr:hypothetical protein [Betaproteobacteria bacterium]
MDKLIIKRGSTAGGLVINARNKIFRSAAALLAFLMLAVASTVVTAATAPEARPTWGPDNKLQRLPDGFPSGPITIWNAFPPGHEDDVYARVMAKAAEGHSPVPLVVRSKSAGPRLWWETLDYFKTLPNGTDGHHVEVAVFAAVPIRLRTVGGGDWTLKETLKGTVVMTEEESLPLASMSDAPWKDLDGMIRWAKANPGKLRIATSAIGSSVHLNAEMLAAARGFTFVALPHKGTALGLATMLGGGAEAVTANIGPVLPHVQAGKVRILLQWGKGTAVFKGAPTTEALGLFAVPTTRGLLTYPDAPAAHIAWLTALFEKAAAAASYEARLTSLGLSRRIMGPQETARYMLELDSRVAPFIEKLGLAKK